MDSDDGKGDLGILGFVEILILMRFNALNLTEPILGIFFSSYVVIGRLPS